MEVRPFLKAMVDRKASDLFITAAFPPVPRWTVNSGRWRKTPLPRRSRWSLLSL